MIKARRNYYTDLAADYSCPGLVSEALKAQLIAAGERFVAMKEATLPAIGPEYPLSQIEQENREYRSIFLSRIGETHRALGNLEKALQFFEEDAKLTKELYESYPQHVGFKNGLAVSYSQLGRFYRDKQPDSAKAKTYFQQCHLLWEDLAQTYPAYIEFQRNLEWVRAILDGL